MIGDIKGAITPCQSRGRVEIVAQHESRLGRSVTVGIAQQDQLVCAFAAGTGLVEQEACYEIAKPVAFSATDLGRPRERDEDIPVRKRLQGAWMVQAVSKASDR